MDLKLILLVALLCAMATAFPRYAALIPNGDSVLNPCDDTVWVGVGHRRQSGGGVLNQFGQDFAAANHTWTRELCQADSDGDGSTNGFELGDRNCDWSATDAEAHLDSVEGHPGICEPVDSLACADSWFSCTTAGVPVGK